MNTKIKFVALVTVLMALAHSAHAEGFIRPSLLYVSPTMSGASTATGFGLAVGGRFGPQAAHELSFEGSWVKWDESANYAGYAVSGSLKYAPCLLNYRYYFGQAASATRFYIGPSAGFACTTASVSAIGPNVNVAVSDSTSSAAYGASLGLVFKLAQKVDLDLGYRYLFVKGNQVTIAGTTVTLDDAKAHVLYAGVSFRF